MSERCLQTLTKVLDKDQTGDASLELVRLLNRMIKERRFNVHPNTLSCLLHLRLKNELGVKASQSKVDRDAPHPQKDKRRKADKKYDPKMPHVSKSAKKAAKERKQIEKLFFKKAEVITASKLVIIYRQVKNGRCLGLIQ